MSSDTLPSAASFMSPRLWLASASPRRTALLASIGVTPERVVAGDIDETVGHNEPAAHYVARMAREKAHAVHAKAAPDQRAGLWVLGADTAIVEGGDIFGKPADHAHFMALSRRLAGRCHQVMSAVALLGPQQRLLECRVTTSVWLSALTDAQRDAYWATGEPCDKAGGYAIQGFGSVFVERIEGSYSAVVGLPLRETATLLAQAGVAMWQGHPPPAI